MNIDQKLHLFDDKIIHWMRRVGVPFARFALFITYFWFGILKVIGTSPATPLVQSLLDVTMPLLPANKPRYLMGVGQPEQMLEAVKRGVDMFDCVLPTRNARHGQMYVRTAEQLVGPELDRVNYRRFNITSAQFSSDTSVLDPWCQCSTCSAGYSKAYLRHLLTIGEPLGLALATVHNVTLYVELMRQIRQHLQTV